MRNLRVEFEAGRNLFDSYWNFLQSGGVVIRQPVGAVEGEPVMVDVRIRSLKKTYRFAGRVARVTSDGRTFVAFDPGQGHDAMVNAAWADTYLVPERKWRRFDVRAEASYASGQSGPRQATITNLSRGGCRIESEERLSVGTTVHLVATGIQSEGKVRWVQPRAFGLEFASPIEAPDLLLT